MPDLVVIVYPSEEKAEEVREKLVRLQREYLIELEDAVIAIKTASGKIRLNQLVSTTAIGALSGSLWGLLIGAIFLMPVLGAAVGAASGALGGALSDVGIEDTFMKELAANLQPGNAALFLLIRRMTTDKVLEAIRGTGGTVIRTSLDLSKEQALREALASESGRSTGPEASASVA